MNSISIRLATANDVDSIADVHVKASRETYTGMIPGFDPVGLSVKSRAEAWLNILEDAASPTQEAVFIAVDSSDRMVGFGCSGRQRSTELEMAGYSGEFQAI